MQYNVCNICMQYMYASQSNKKYASFIYAYWYGDYKQNSIYVKMLINATNNR